MKVMITGRQMGKTTNIVAEWIQDGGQDAILLVHNRREKERLVDVFKLSEDQRGRVFTYEMIELGLFLGRNRSQLYPRVFVDNLDLWLHYYVHKHIPGGQVQAATLTADEWEARELPDPAQTVFPLGDV